MRMLPSSCGGQLTLFLCLFLNLRNLLSLGAGSRYLHSQDDVPDLALGQTRHVDVVLFAVVGQDEILQGHLDLDPLVVREAGPDVVRLGDGRLVRLQDDLGPVVVDVQRAQDEDETGEGGVGGDGPQPVVLQVEQNHLGLGSLQDQVAELLHFQAGLPSERRVRLARHRDG